MRQEILSRIDIQEYIHRFVPLQHKGRDQYTGLCPFHHEKTPSFSVSTEKKFFHCFGCKASGDVIKFVMLYENISFENAIQKLSDELGIKNNVYIQKNLDILNLNTLFAKICTEFLNDANSYYGMKYVKSRGILSEIVEKYQLGYFPLNKVNEIFDKLKNDFDEEIIFKSGIFKMSERLYSPFASRIIFPIYNDRNQCVGFGSRVINDEHKPKYLNSSDSEWFHKSELLYGYYKLHGDAQLKKTQTVFVVEGYMDVISLANHGITNAVGVLGANLTSSQLQLLWKMTNKPIICLDNDNAGKVAMERIAKMSLKILEPGKTIAFLELKVCKDPDEYIKQHGTEKFLQLFHNDKISLADYLYKVNSRDLSLSDPDEVVVLRQRIANICNEITNDTLRNEYKKHFHRVFYTQQSLRKIPVKRNNTNDSQAKVLMNMKTSSLHNDEIEICNIISQYRGLLMNQEILDDFMSCKFLSEKALKMQLELTKDICAGYLNSHENLSEIKKTLTSLLIGLKIKNVQNEMMNLRKSSTSAESLDMRLLELKKYEIQLKKKLSSTLI